MSTESQLYEIKLKTDQFSSKLDQIESKMNNFEKKVGGVGSSLAGVFGGNLLANAAANAFSIIKDTAFQVVKLGADFEQTKVSFETMLGSADMAASVLDKLKQFAAATPFRFTEVVSASKQLLAFGFGADQLTDNLSRLGDVASGLSIPLGDLIYLYGTLKTSGHVGLIDIRQFAQRGIPIYEALAKVMKVNKSEINSLVHDGKIGFEDVEKAFISLTAKGSMFGGLMDKQSKTLAGRWSTFQDKLEESGTELGTKLLPYLGAALDKITEIFEGIQKVDFSEWTKPLLQIWDSLKGIGSSLADIFDLEGNGGAFLSSLRQLVKDVLLMTNSLVAVVDYVAKRSKAAGTSADWDKSMSQEQIDSFYERNPGKELTFESVLNDKLQNAADAWSGKKSDSELMNDKNKSQFDRLNAFRSQVQMDKLAAQNKTAGSVDSAKSAGKSIGVEKVASSTRNINISIENLVKEITFSKTESWKESESQFVERIKRALLTVVNDVNVVAN